MKRYLMASAGVLILLAACAYVSARAGYNAARFDSMSCSTGSDATYTASILERLRAGDVSQVQAMLETRLDGLLIDRWVYDRRSSRLITLLARPNEIDVVPSLIGTAAEYRLAHPSTHPNEKVRSKIAEVVAKYQPLAIQPQSSPN